MRRKAGLANCALTSGSRQSGATRNMGLAAERRIEHAYNARIDRGAVLDLIGGDDIASAAIEPKPLNFNGC
jgi:hypothetical protein